LSQIVDGAARALEEGRAAHARYDWPQAYELLSAADEESPLEAEDLARLAESAWWTARLDQAIRYRERAYNAYLRSGNDAQAAWIALDLVLDYVSKLKHKLAMAALRRAERLLASQPEGAVHGYLACVKGMIATSQGDFEGATALGRQAQELGRRFGAGDLETLGQLVEGRALISIGQVEEGLALLDEATSAAVSGELTPLSTGIVYCATISACGELADYERAGEWTEAAELWCEQAQLQSGFPGICRVHRAEVKRYRGEWADAEEEASRAAEELMNFSEDVVGQAYYEIGEVRLLRGDLDGAEEAFRQANQFQYDPQPGMALLYLARGRTEAAASSIERSLAGQTAHKLARAKLLPAQVDIAVAAGHLEPAQAAAQELEEIAEHYRSPSPVLKATAAAARAEVHLAVGDATSAVACAQAALAEWRRTKAPYETARTRMVLARAYAAAGDVDAARLETESALAAFERLGAAPATRAANDALADLTGSRQVTRTFMFTDVVESTQFIRRIGDEAWAALLRSHDRALRGLFAEHGGEEVDHAGDGFFVAFVDAASAIDCAAAIQRRIAEEGRFGELLVRVGVHTASASLHGSSYRGRGVHEAARIAGLAGPAEIVASVATLEAAGYPLEQVDRHSAHLKGIDEPLDVVTFAWR
jgi:class 3 adenylate cyclase